MAYNIFYPSLMVQLSSLKTSGLELTSPPFLRSAPTMLCLKELTTPAAGLATWWIPATWSTTTAPLCTTDLNRKNLFGIFKSN